MSKLPALHPMQRVMHCFTCETGTVIAPKMGTMNPDYPLVRWDRDLCPMEHRAEFLYPITDEWILTW